MGTAPGVAGNRVPEEGGVFLARDLEEARWFAGFGHAKRVDIWRVDVAGLEIDDPDAGWPLYRGVISPGRLELVEVREATGRFDAESVEVPRDDW